MRHWAYTRPVLPAPPPAASDQAPLAPAPPRAPGATPGTPGRTPAGVRWALAGTAIAGCAYVAVADPNRPSSWYPVCPFKALTGLDCPGCGITRALHALLTGHPLRAFDHNALVMLVVVVGLVWFAVNRLRARRGRPPLELSHPAWWGAAFGALVAVFWVVRNLPWEPFRWLGSTAAGA